jgi:Tfp pilus assembly protein PilX
MPQRHLHREDGWVLVSAIVLLAVLLSIGLAAFSYVDTGSKRSREQRERESSLNLAEAALYGQGFVLRDHWPSPPRAGVTPPDPIVQDCARSMTPVPDYCPKDSTLADQSSGNFTTTDFKSGVTWTTSVRDNTGVLANAYSTTAADQTLVDPVKGACPQTPCRMDWNDDGKVWVEARAVVRGRPRNLVALLQLERIAENVPTVGVVAGGVNVSNRGGNMMIDATGSSVVLRCDTTQQTCSHYANTQIVPQPTGNVSQQNFMTPAQLARFKERAQTDNRYFPGCPASNADLSGPVVWVEGCTSPPTLANQVGGRAACRPAAPSGMSQSCINQQTTPGLLIWHCGRADFQGSFTYVGVLYAANNSDGTCPASLPAKSGSCFDGNQAVGPADVVNTNGGFGVWGALVIDGGGCLHVGSNGLQVKYDGSAFGAATSYGTVGLVQNTWRELAPN